MIAVTVHPSFILSANQRLHWVERSRRTATLRDTAAAAWIAAGRPTYDRVHLVVRICYPNALRRDVHNLMPTVKALVDGLVHPHPRLRGLLPDDSDDYLIGPDLRPDPRHGGGGRFTFTFDIEEAS